MFDYSENKYRRTREVNGYLETDFYQDPGAAQIQQETTPHSEFQQSAEFQNTQQIVEPASSQGQYGQYTVASPTSAFKNLYDGGQAQRQDYGGSVWTSASSFQAVPSAGSQLVNPANYSGPPYTPNEFNNASRYDPVSGISNQLANTTLSGSPGPRDPAFLASNRLVSGDNTGGKKEKLDPRFCVIKEPKRFFKVGRVFAVLWSEPAGEQPAGKNVDWNDEDDYETIGRFGERVHTKIRRFVVVREGDRHSTCLPLLTYQGQGTLKRGVKPDDHAAVYAENPKNLRSKEKLLAGEKLRKNPFAIIIEDSKETIDPLTRINFSKIYTVEHNVKALKIGRIPDTDLLRKYFIESVAGPEVTSQGSYAQASGPSAQMGESTPQTSGLTPNDVQNYAFMGEQVGSGDFQLRPNSSSADYQTPHQGFNQSFDPGGNTQYQQSSTRVDDSGRYNQSNQSNLYPDPSRFTGGEMVNETNDSRDYPSVSERYDAKGHSREDTEQIYNRRPRYDDADLTPPRPASSMSYSNKGERRDKHSGRAYDKDRDRDRRRR